MAGKSYEALNYRKTPRGQRGTYTYEFADGEKITVIPGAEGCTEIDIRRLHSIDDHEVYVNIKVSGAPVRSGKNRSWSNGRRITREKGREENGICSWTGWQKKTMKMMPEPASSRGRFTGRAWKRRRNHRRNA